MNQLVLPLRLADHAVFESFHAAGSEVLVATLTEIAAGQGDHGCWLWGAPATGKTHLLQATCDRAGDSSVYVPLSTVSDAGPAILEGLAGRQIVCIDDVDAVAGDEEWETALFDLCNQITDTGGQLVASAASAPRESVFELEDLRSRLSRLPIFHLHPLDDEQRVAALQLRARHRGFELPGETARYLMKRSRRDMASLFSVLDKLDLESLRAQRRLTIPFVRDALRL